MNADPRPVAFPRRGIGRVLLGLLPVWFLVILWVAFPGFMDPAFANPPAVAGLPAGVLVIASALAIMAIGVEVMRRTESDQTALLAFIGLTLPSAIVVFVTPALILIVQGM